MTTHVEHVMGTAVTVEIRDRVVPALALERAFAQLRWVDRMFSTYDADSEISRINAGKRHVRVLDDNWTVVTKDHSLSAQWEHMVLVTPTGHEVLTLSPRAAAETGH